MAAHGMGATVDRHGGERVGGVQRVRYMTHLRFTGFFFLGFEVKFRLLPVPELRLGVEVSK